MKQLLPSLLILLLFTGLPAYAAIKGEPVDYSANGVTLKGYLAYDTDIKGKRPGVLVVHEWWGHNEYARKRARMLAELGYTALAIDMYGDGKNTGHPNEAKKFMMAVINNMAVAEARFMAAQTFLKTQHTVDTDKIAAMGYCFGGGIVLAMARAGVDLDGVASFHGSLATKTPAKQGIVKAKLLVVHGEADQFVSPEQVKDFKQEMENAKVDLEFVGYPGVQHSFTNPEADQFAKRFGIPVAYDKTADEDSWKTLQDFLKRIFAD
ncbi:MAG: dienelactone hydrolase family protein [Candidatus Parabeggiatoa sp. nov. 3]|nr:MAG: dienelactone hydrolase family protein [Gammaproteobacteria bacterium]RKZ64006.1 MAG: dienelactone hydrolase family protein [Gammaproteobacteria bacterium]RKZ84059.1 MAG: dienelactone hydrolase family protein [Gammaproteobacteria bacterium]